MPYIKLDLNSHEWSEIYTKLTPEEKLQALEVITHYVSGKTIQVKKQYTSASISVALAVIRWLK